MAINIDKQKIREILERGVVSEILPSREEFEKKLFSGERLRIYLGADPTSTSLHLGHARNYMFLEELRQLGHEVIVLVGDFTAQIGDPSDKEATRPALSEAQVRENMQDWENQIRLVLDFEDKNNPPQIQYNSEWLGKLSFRETLDLASEFTVQQMLERDMFEKRMKEGSPIHLHEFLYPLMQGYDSVALDVDAELCGTDQTFNALVGRTLLKRLKNKEKFVIALSLIGNPKTGQLMSKSAGTGIFLSASPADMYGALMAQPDEMTEIFLVNLTRIPLSEKDNILSLGPRDAKARAAFEIVKRLHGEEKAKEAEKAFEETFQKGNVPEDIPEIHLQDGDFLEQLIRLDIVPSKSEWKRLVEGNAVETEQGQKVADPAFVPSETQTLKIGKRRFVKIIV